MRPLAFAVLLLVPLVAAQGHEHGPGASGVVVAHDLHLDGDTYVGNLNHFVVLYLGDDAAPEFHQQNHVQVRQGDDVVFATTPDSGHDYDGVYGFDVTFGRAGPFVVEVLQEGEVVASFPGVVREQVGAVVGTTPLTIDPQPAGYSPAADGYTLTYGAAEDGAPLAHSDAVLEVFSGPDAFHVNEDPVVPLQSQALVLRVKTHTHEDPQVVRLRFDDVDTMNVRVATYQSYPRPDGGDFAPAFSHAALSHTANDPTADPVAALPTLPPVPANRVVVGDAGAAYTLQGTFDPYDVVGPRTLQHLSALVLDAATRAPVQHVDFRASLVGPGGDILFASDTLHEYDGVLEVETVQTLPGPYRLVVDAERGDWTGHLELPYLVAASPAATVAAGPQLVMLEAPASVVAGTAGRFTFRIADAAGLPFQHGEVDLVAERLAPGQAGDIMAYGQPILRAKLHTHGDGVFSFDAAFPDAGPYLLRALPYSLGSTATPHFFNGLGGEYLTWPIDVAAAPAPAATEDDAPAGADAPLAAWPLLVALALAVALRRRS